MAFMHESNKTHQAILTSGFIADIDSVRCHWGEIEN